MIKIAIVIREGNIESIFCNGENTNCESYIIDWDNIEGGGQDYPVVPEEIEHISKERFDELILEANSVIKENNERY